GKYKTASTLSYPGLIILDLNMPKKDGREALKEIKSDPRLRHIPIIILTTSKSEEDIFRTHDMGANSVILKPVTYSGLVEIMRSLTQYWLEVVELPL
ncbi:MAG: response regulator, partial [Anaerolineales bacterium]